MAALTRRIGSAVLLMHFLFATLAAIQPGVRTVSSSSPERARDRASTFAGRAAAPWGGERLHPDTWQVERVLVSSLVPLATSGSHGPLGSSRAEGLSRQRGGFDPQGDAGSGEAGRPIHVSSVPRELGPELRPGEPVLAAGPRGAAVEAFSRLHRARLGRLSSPTTAPPDPEPNFPLG